MSESVVKRGRTWSYYVDLPEAEARYCTAEGTTVERAGRAVVVRHRVWADEHVGDECPKCGAPLGPRVKCRRTKWVGGFATAKEAKAARRAALGTLDAGGDPFPKQITLRDFVHERWVPHMRTTGKPREATWKRYVELLDRWVLTHLGGMDTAKIGPRHVQVVLDRVTAAGKSPRTAAHVRAATSAAFAQAMRWQIVGTNPCAATQTPQAVRPELRIPNAKELRAIIAAAEGTPWAIPVLLSATTGARRSEVLAMKWANVDLEAGRVRITETIVEGEDGLRFGPPKTKSAVRTVPLPPFAVERLKAHKASQARRHLRAGADEWTDLDLVCERGDGQAVSPGAYTHAFARLAEKAGFADVRLHDLRHGVATELARSGASPLATSRMLGHASVAFTQSVYQHADDEMVDLAAARLAEAFGS